MLIMPKQKAPESMEDVEKRVFRRAWLWLRRQPLWIKILLAILAGAYFIAFSRMDLIGETFYRLSTFIIPLQKPALFLTLDYSVQGAQGSRIGKKNDVCHNGDYISLCVIPSDSCWLTLFCIDSKGIHPLFNSGLEPQMIRGEKPLFVKFNLDTTIGNDVYCAIAARKNYSFEKTIKPNLDKSNAGVKGPDFGDFRLNIPRGFFYEYFGFRHEN
jgi:hypothetical protein